MSILDVPGARLYYETHGSGQLLIMIPGAGGSGDVFRRATEHLAAQYKVVLYDRRGYSRSELDGPQDYDHRPATDADDVRSLIEHLGAGPAIVFGASSGAIVALEVLTRHPSVVATVVPFEPPVMRYLPDGQQWMDFFTRTYDLYCESGIEPATERFRVKTFPPSDVQAMAHAPRNDANAAYWFEHELRQYPSMELDLDALATRADRIVFAAGQMGHGYPAHDVTAVLAKELGARVIDLPGGHIGCVSHPDGFAAGLVATLNRDDAPTPPILADQGDGSHHPTHLLGSMGPSQWGDLYAGRPDWDLGRPQSAFRALADEGVFRGRVLDVGCGTGEHVLMCAELGLDVTGVDFAPAALNAAKKKATGRHLTARFLQHDARKLGDLGESFETVLDCGLFHVFGDEDRAAYIDSVRTVLVPGGHYYILCFSDQQPGDQGPRRSSREDLIAAFTDGWQIDSIDPTTLDSDHYPGGVHGWLVALTRKEEPC
jgi:pimeloyl-ACP methyl ester carboxylesterase/SAM-dependent methyltransferase